MLRYQEYLSLGTQMVNNDWQISTIVTFLKNSAWQNANITVKTNIENYDLAANIPETGFFGTGCTFLAAILDVFPPKPAHLIIGFGFAD
jgi:hypothetical protein